MEFAELYVSMEWDLVSLATAAGWVFETHGPYMFDNIAIKIVVPGVSQADLETALQNYDDSSYTTKKLDPQWAQIRTQRNTFLDSCDWTQTVDYPAGNQAAWATYRQALRDIPQNQTDPFNITWPTQP